MQTWMAKNGAGRHQRAPLSDRGPEIENESPTERVSIVDIVLPDNFKSQQTAQLGPKAEEATSLFAFEQTRLQALGQASVDQLMDTGPKPEADPHTADAELVLKRNKELLEHTALAISNWMLAIKLLVVVSISWSALLTVGGMIYSFILTINIEHNFILSLIPMLGSMLTSVWVIFVSIRASRLNALTDSAAPEFPSFLKLGAATILLFLILLITMSVLQSITELMASVSDLTASHEGNEGSIKRANAYFALSYCFAWTSCILNGALVGLQLASVILLRRHRALWEVYELQQRALPLGYQIYIHSKHDVAPSYLEDRSIVPAA